MKRTLIVGILLLQTVLQASAQFTLGKADTVSVVEWKLPLETQYTDQLTTLKRYTKDMERFAQYNQIPDSTHCDILFLGSSSIRRWNSLKQDMAPAKVINRAFGGSMMRTQLFEYDVVVKPMKADKIVLYVENDLPSVKTPVTVYQTFDFFRTFCGKLRQDFPEAKIYILSLKPSPSRTKFWNAVNTLNFLLKEYCASNADFTYVDVATPMFNEKGEPQEDIFGSDRLHMNEKGYQLWTGIVRKAVLEDCGCDAEN